MKQKKIPFLIFLICFCAIALLFYAMSPLQMKQQEEETQQDYTCHFQIIKETDSPEFWDLFCEGADEAAEEKNIYLEYVETNTSDAGDRAELVKRGVYAGVDGIAFRPTDIEESSAVVDFARENEVPVITVESEENVLPLVGSVNSDYHEVGVELGNLLLEATGGEGNVSIIMNEKDMQTGEALCNTEKIRGIMEVLPENDELKILEYYKVDTDLYQTASVIGNVFEEHPETDCLICTDSGITENAAAYLKKEGLTDQVLLIGSGYSDSIQELLDDGTLYGTVYADAREMGRKVVEKLYSIYDGSGQEDIENLSVKVLTGEE